MVPNLTTIPSTSLIRVKKNYNTEDVTVSFNKFFVSVWPGLEDKIPDPETTGKEMVIQCFCVMWRKMKYWILEITVGANCRLISMTLTWHW